MEGTSVQNESKTTVEYALYVQNELAKSTLLTESWPVPLILGMYLTLIIVDKYMLKNRKPLELKVFMMVYNVYQVFYNLYMFYLCVLPELLQYYMHHYCHPLNSSNSPLRKRSSEVLLLFFISKLTDLIDTVFIVLRKKYDQISFLHLYHHMGMAIFTWIFLKYYVAEQLIMIVLVNSFVHVVMYVYYSLSALGPSIQKYLWWKRHVTILQMAQFLFFAVYMGHLVYEECSQPKGVSFFIITQAVLFFKMFYDFYNKKYQEYKPKEVQSSKEK